METRGCCPASSRPRRAGPRAGPPMAAGAGRTPAPARPGIGAQFTAIAFSIDRVSLSGTSYRTKVGSSARRKQPPPRAPAPPRPTPVRVPDSTPRRFGEPMKQRGSTGLIKQSPRRWRRGEEDGPPAAQPLLDDVRHGGADQLDARMGRELAAGPEVERLGAVDEDGVRKGQRVDVFVAAGEDPGDCRRVSARTCTSGSKTSAKIRCGLSCRLRSLKPRMSIIATATLPWTFFRPLRRPVSGARA